MAAPDAASEYFPTFHLLHVLSASDSQADDKSIFLTHCPHFASTDLTPFYLPTKHPYKFLFDPELAVPVP